MVVVGFIMMTFVVPTLLGLFKDLNADLPIQTQILIGLSSILSRFWILIVAGTALAVYSIKRYLKTPLGKENYDRLILQIPVIKNVIKMSTLVDSTRTLSTLIGSGV